MIGAGQLARMSVAPAQALGVGLRVLATDAGESAAQVARDIWLGRHDDMDAVLAAATGVDVVTFDHEHVPPPILAALEERGTPVRPGPAALAHAQDKITLREALADINIPQPAWTVVETPSDVSVFAHQVGWPVVLKTSRGGYDGRGVWVVDDLTAATQLLATTPLPAQAAWLVEEFVPFSQELAAQVARSPHGQAVAYPIVQTTQINGICVEVIAPAPNLSDAHAAEAQRLALTIAGQFDVTGMLAVELFHAKDGRILVNELAMRPHNSGHWSIDGAVTSQFENHLRAVLDLPLGSPLAVAPYAVMVNVLGGDHPDLYAAFKHVMARDPGLRVHLYGKQVRPGRKVGHVTVIGADLEDLLDRARHAAGYLTGTITE
jgi:5-(carboxyamino)imidazole ribonucleotide synthase